MREPQFQRDGRWVEGRARLRKVGDRHVALFSQVNSARKERLRHGQAVVVDRVRHALRRSVAEENTRSNPATPVLGHPCRSHNVPAKDAEARVCMPNVQQGVRPVVRGKVEAIHALQTGRHMWRCLRHRYSLHVLVHPLPRRQRDATHDQGGA